MEKKVKKMLKIHGNEVDVKENSRHFSIKCTFYKCATLIALMMNICLLNTKTCPVTIFIITTLKHTSEFYLTKYGKL